MYRPEEWDSMPNGFDNTRGIVRESNVSSTPFSFFTSSASPNTYIYFLLFLA